MTTKQNEISNGDCAAEIAWMAVQCIQSFSSQAQCEGRIALEALEEEEKRHAEVLAAILTTLKLEGMIHVEHKPK